MIEEAMMAVNGKDTNNTNTDLYRAPPSQPKRVYPQDTEESPSQAESDRDTLDQDLQRKRLESNPESSLPLIKPAWLDPDKKIMMASGLRLLQGAFAGLIATVPMSIVMERLYQQLPSQEKYPLPPNQIISHVVSEDDMPEHQIITFLGHFAYGATAGAAYPVIFDRIPLPAPLKGIGFGLAVWLISYQGWLPAFRILPPATQQSPRRNLLMVIAHLVWGGTVALLSTHQLASDDL